MRSKWRACLCGEVSAKSLAQPIKLCGWVNAWRDHGGVIFIDLRDHSGLVQLVFDPANVDKDVFKVAEDLRNEYVISIEGVVRERPEGTVNPDLATGSLEVLCKDIELLNKAHILPFTPDEHNRANEETRLEYRPLDLRSPTMQANLRFRAALVSQVRRFLEENAFVELETPILTRSTPEGARDYLVPSRTHSGSFFALPQSPQLFKQILMMGGMDRYYQIARCFRDEDLRSDRQPEFTQIDLEMAFAEEKDMMDLAETMMRHLFKKLLGIRLPVFPRLTYAEALARYGTDRPDLRIPLQLIDIDEECKSVKFDVFRQAANDEKQRVAMLSVPGGEQLSRKDIDELTRYVGEFGAKGLAYIRVLDPAGGRDQLQSPIIKFFSDEFLASLLERAAAQAGHILFFGAAEKEVVNASLSALRERLADRLKLRTEGWQPLWVTEFPMFEFNSKEGSLDPLHHPFTALEDYAPIEKLAASAHTPSVPTEDFLEHRAGNYSNVSPATTNWKKDVLALKSRAYDMVINGVEVGGGSVRIHQGRRQREILRLLGLSPDETEKRFGFFLRTLDSGAPPHSGLAFGLDRLVMLMRGLASIRDAICFPKTQSAHCPLTEAPTYVGDKQLKALNLRLLRTDE